MERALAECLGHVARTGEGRSKTSKDYRALLTRHDLTCSMSRRVNCYDNAVMESFLARFKAELGECFESARAATVALFDFIEVFYNHQRRHSTLGNVTPGECAQRTFQPAMVA